MHRIDAAGFAAGNLFTDGNPSTGTPATVVDAAWLNDVQENIVGLIAAAGIALSKGDYTQLLTALRSAGIFQTQPQFDNSTKAATTSFVKLAGLLFNTQNVVTTSTILSAAHSGSRITVNASCTVTLPAASAVSTGSVITIGSVASTVIVSPSAGNTIEATTGNITLAFGDQVILMSDGGAVWLKVVDTSLTADKAKNPSFLASNGYKQFRDGTILQWVNGSAGQLGASVANSFPIAFPTACIGAIGIHSGTDASVNIIRDSSLMNTTQVGMRSSYGSISVSCFIIAIGY
jgi:hypothetical protein